MVCALLYNQYYSDNASDDEVNLKFNVHKQIPDIYETNTFYLLKGSFHKGRLDDSWNDFAYRTIYTLLYSDANTKITDIGCVKIGERGMNDTRRSPNLPSAFEKLDNNFFSISNNEDYYKNASVLKGDLGYELLLALNDFVVRRDTYKSVMGENVVSTSLLREWGCKLDEHYMNRCLNHLAPPINLETMRRIYGSTGWEDVDKALIEMQRLLFQANISLYYNAIATIGREIIIRITNEIYDDELHRDKEAYPNTPKKDQCKNKLCGFVDYTYGKGNITESLKNHMKYTIELVNGYIHKDNAEPFECFLCVNAVITMVFQLSIICNKERYNEVIS